MILEQPKWEINKIKWNLHFKFLKGPSKQMLNWQMHDTRKWKWCNVKENMDCSFEQINLASL